MVQLFPFPAQCGLDPEGAVRLQGLSGSALAGRVEVCHNGLWGTICGDSATEPWRLKNAQVVCKQLGRSGALNAILQQTYVNWLYVLKILWYGDPLLHCKLMNASSLECGQGTCDANMRILLP